MRVSGVVLLMGVCLLAPAPDSTAADPIGEVFSCGREGVAGGLGAGDDLLRQTVDTTRYPEALCNDGTPAVFYYGAATTEEDRDKWVIYLQGGGSCVSGQLCAQRWCSVDTNYGMDKMSSSLTRPQVRAGGLLAPDARNRFGTWNRVLVFYCSSDAWTGTATRTLSASVNETDSRQYTIHFKGSRILEAVLDTLRYAPPARRRALARASVAVTAANLWPDLDDATEVIFGGSSAGGAGVRANADRVGERLRATNPDLRYAAVIDAIYGTMSENRDFTVSTYCASDPRACTYEGFMKLTRQEIDVNLYGARDDDSCAAWHAANAPGSEWRCSDGEHVNLNHLSTPWFVRHDLQDKNIGRDYVDAGFGDAADYASAVESELRDLAEPEEPFTIDPGRFVPQCTHHESFTDNEAIFSVRLGPYDTHDVLWNWWTGAQPAKVIRPFSGTPGPAPECP